MQQTPHSMLNVRDLRTYLHLKRGVVKAVDGVSFYLNQGETLGIVGESGSGKTMTMLSILRLLPNPSRVQLQGHIELDGVDLLGLSEKVLAREYRGKKISMISQDPLSSLNPVFSIGDQVGAPAYHHGLIKSRAQYREHVVRVLDSVRIPSPDTRFNDYPHQFSGGMRQRVVTGIAIGSQPRLLLADEPTSALDVTIQVQMIDLFKQIQESTKVGIVLVTHDLGVAASMCHRIAVMYAGRVVETASVRDLYHSPQHPYTQALLKSIPQLGRKEGRLFSIDGSAPSLINAPQGCRFAERCPHQMPLCHSHTPPETHLQDGHSVSCWLHQETT